MLGDLRQELLDWLLLPTAIASIYALVLTNILLNVRPLSNIGVSVLVVCACLLARRIKSRRPRLAAYVYVSGLAMAILVLTWLLFMPITLVLLPAVILLSIAILGVRHTMAVAVLASLIILASAQHHHQSSAAAVGPIAAVWVTAVGAWLSHRNLITATEWAWNSLRQARTSTEEARRHRAELARTLKALDEAYYRLERFSVQLAEARDAAEEARRIKQQFVANVSHELRTPLNIIIGFSETIALSPEAYGVKAVPRQFMGDVNRIYRSAQHLKSLIDDVLDLSQIDARHMPLITEQTSLSQVIAEATDMIGSLATQKGLSLTLDVPNTLPSIFMDRLRIRQVLLNLLSNAVRFTDVGGITVSAQMEDKEILVMVADTGPGIAPEDLDKVFEEFHQVDASLSRRYGGTGLGLALSRRFVELHGGRMGVESELGRGSRFYFSLPLTPTASGAGNLKLSPLTVSSQTEARVGRTILVAGREPMVVNLLKRHLRDYQVRSVSDEELPEAIATYLPRAVIINGMLSSVAENGHQPAVTEDRALPVPVISCPLPDPRHLSRTLGVDHYLVKPITRERLLSLLESYGDAVRRVLIVDDDAQLAELMARIARSAPRPYAVDVACGGEEGLVRMCEACPDLVLLDLIMERLDGLAVLQLMRADDRLREIPVAIITARDLPGEEVCLPGRSNINVESPEGFTVTEVLNCVQAILNALPPPRPASSLLPTPAVDQPALLVS
jgi:signal transduction histidine kinase/CheY-like chemotaxis protein